MITAISVFTCCYLQFFEVFFNRSDDRVNRASTSGSVDSEFDSESGQTNDVKIDIHNFPA